ncbi:MAG TPA: bile acid:sodium symporter [Burkholderiaceae bacterium]|jgi:sodium/bile acid cotransporter 7
MSSVRRLKKEWFLLALFSMILLASLWPALGRTGGLLRLDRLSNGGVALIFFMTGLGLSLKELGGGLLRWRAHLLVQLSTFAIFPILGVGSHCRLRAGCPQIRRSALRTCAPCLRPFHRRSP